MPIPQNLDIHFGMLAILVCFCTEALAAPHPFFIRHEYTRLEFLSLIPCISPLVSAMAREKKPCSLEQTLGTKLERLTRPLTYVWAAWRPLSGTTLSLANGTRNAAKFTICDHEIDVRIAANLHRMMICVLIFLLHTTRS